MVFAKYPTPGRVKTRLIGEVSAQQAAGIHAACIRHTMGVVTRVAADVWLAISPDSADFSDFADGAARIAPQGAGDLGERLARLSREAFDCGYRRLALVGCDCFHLGPDDVALAFEGLQDRDVVIGPALDGGYYLLATRDFTPGLFIQVDWGSERVHAQTLERIAAAGLTYRDLRYLPDLDRPEDLRRLLEDVGATAGVAKLRDELIAITKEGGARGGD
ncbi:MAG: TIGR04282 family arsenosugar biosynthesis glycosyltransferase [Phycisphaerales bacterium]|nr:TIGR04282 family arsenosugar biosynthesis glycosyltransferase [Phycisphaerales bacterium]